MGAADDDDESESGAPFPKIEILSLEQICDNCNWQQDDETTRGEKSKNNNGSSGTRRTGQPMIYAACSRLTIINKSITCSGSSSRRGRDQVNLPAAAGLK